MQKINKQQAFELNHLPVNDHISSKKSSAANIANNANISLIENIANIADIGNTANTEYIANIGNIANIAKTANIKNTANIGNAANTVNIANTAKIGNTLQMLQKKRKQQAFEPNHLPVNGRKSSTEITKTFDIYMYLIDIFYIFDRHLIYIW